MARKSSLTAEKLKDLGIDKLAQLIAEEAERNAGLRRQIKAAIAGKDGPQAIVKQINRRLSGLERARSFIDWDRARAFRDDVRSLVDTITKELGPASSVMAIECLLRFTATHEQVFERVDDSSGYIQDVYYGAIEAIGVLAQNLAASDAAHMPDKVMGALGKTTHGYLGDVANAVVPHLPQETLQTWDQELNKAVKKRKAEEASRKSDGWVYSMASQWDEIRQIIAETRQDVDGFIAIESQKPTHRQDTQAIASMLLEADRASEALEWINKSDTGDSHNRGSIELNAHRVSLKARILEALGRNQDAQALRWRGFENRLSSDLLRQYLKQLPDFEDIEAKERAMAVALDHDIPELALEFFLQWPRIDLAARLIVKNHQHWHGRDWHILPKIAADLAHEHPLAATILYRALLNDILERARSKAYGHGARYLKQLATLADGSDRDPTKPNEIVDHAAYLATLKKSHGRKTGFWQLVVHQA